MKKRSYYIILIFFSLTLPFLANISNLQLKIIIQPRTATDGYTTVYLEDCDPVKNQWELTGTSNMTFLIPEKIPATSSTYVDERVPSKSNDADITGGSSTPFYQRNYMMAGWKAFAGQVGPPVIAAGDYRFHSFIRYSIPTKSQYLLSGNIGMIMYLHRYSTSGDTKLKYFNADPLQTGTITWNNQPQLGQELGNISFSSTDINISIPTPALTTNTIAITEFDGIYISDAVTGIYSTQDPTYYPNVSVIASKFYQATNMLNIQTNQNETLIAKSSLLNPISVQTNDLITLTFLTNSNKTIHLDMMDFATDRILDSYNFATEGITVGNYTEIISPFTVDKNYTFDSFQINGFFNTGTKLTVESIQIERPIPLPPPPVDYTPIIVGVIFLGSSPFIIYGITYYVKKSYIPVDCIKRRGQLCPDRKGRLYTTKKGDLFSDKKTGKPMRMVNPKKATQRLEYYD
jgi:hypothetical protein